MGPAERSNLIIAVGDLTFRWPNLLEPWTAHIYQPLSDPDQGAPLYDPCRELAHGNLQEPPCHAAWRLS